VGFHPGADSKGKLDTSLLGFIWLGWAQNKRVKGALNGVRQIRLFPSRPGYGEERRERRIKQVMGIGEKVML